MARKPMITRTVNSTVATVLCLDLAEQKPFEREVILPRTYKTVADMLKVAEHIVNAENVKAVHIKDYHVEETRYGMTEEDFINSDKIQILPKLVKPDKDTDE